MAKKEDKGEVIQKSKEKPDEKTPGMNRPPVQVHSKEASDKSYYEWLLDHDVTAWLEELRKANGWNYRLGDMKLEIKPFQPVITPWHYIKSIEGDCYLMHHILFNQLSPKVNFQFIPSYCRDCYKVVVRPKTLDQLFALEKVQVDLKRSSKCGIEIRNYVPALYGGYFYNRGVEEGRECYKIVRKAIDQHKDLGPDVDVYLKRACTEMEQKYGDSDKWLEITKDQEDIEALIKKRIAYDPRGEPQAASFLVHVHRWWIEWAFQNGDSTYLNYTGGRPIEPAAITYHEE